MHQYHILFLAAKLKLSQISKAGGIKDNFLNSPELIFGNDNDCGKVANAGGTVESFLFFLSSDLTFGKAVSVAKAAKTTPASFDLHHGKGKAHSKDANAKIQLPLGTKAEKTKFSCIRIERRQH